MSVALPGTAHRYFPALDTLRTIAVMLVVISHWLPYDHPLNSVVPNGSLGVTLFFVLSGFLITGILLEEKEKILKKNTTVGAVFKNFYLKRLLRIFPVYYLTLAIMLVMKVPEVARYSLWHFSYLSNVLFYLNKSWVNEFVSPFWSLSVEEQFYIFWPFLILFSKRKWLLPMLFMTIAAGIFFRMLPANIHARPYSFLQILTPFCIDCFAVGGLISYIRFYMPEKLALLKKIFAILSVLGGFYIFVINLFFFKSDFINVVFHRNIFSSFAASYILFVLTQQDIKNWLAKDLENAVTVYIGKISYSLYLWHNLIPYFTDIESEHQRFFARLGILICISSLSYFLFERPVLSLKKFIRATTPATSEKANLSNINPT